MDFDYFEYIINNIWGEINLTKEDFEVFENGLFDLALLNEG